MLLAARSNTVCLSSTAAAPAAAATTVGLLLGVPKVVAVP